MLLSSDPKIQAFEVDCMKFMQNKPDKTYDLAIVDPPYGIDVIDKTYQNKKTRPGKAKAHKTNYTPKDWDKKSPDKPYFDELIRVSKNQIVWGANHFISKIPYDSSCWIVWDKCNGNNDFADCELAWTSFSTAVRKFKYVWNGMLQENMKFKQNTIHPNEKPVKLYEWLLTKYAKPGFKILDTHGGSMSLAIACYNLGFDLDICEMDADYFQDATDRVKAHIAKPKGLFTYRETMRTEPNKLF